MSVKILPILLLSCSACGLFGAEDSVIMPGLVKNFELPNFDEKSGFKDWELFGSSAKFVSDSKLLITDLKLDLYDGKATQLKRATFKSPRADVYPDLNEGGSNESVEISGDGFLLTGKRWLWSGKKNRIDIYSDVVLDISGKSAEAKTRIKSKEASFSNLSDGNKFNFRKNVSVENADAKTLCENLEVNAAKEGGKTAQDSVENIIATGNVRFESDGKKSSSGYAKIFPKENLVELLDGPQLLDEDSKASLSGARILVNRADNSIKSFSDKTRKSTAIIIDESDPSAPDTVFISSKETLLKQNSKTSSDFFFKDDVRVTSSKFKAEADTLTANATASKSGGSEISKIEGLGNVRLFKDSRAASARKLEVFPQKGETWLTDSAKLEETQKGVTLESKLIILLQNSQTALAISDKKNPEDFVVTTLAGGMEDLDDSAAPKSAGKKGGSKTVIKSRNLKSVRKSDATILSFTGDVNVSSEGMNASCKVMDVYADSVSSDGGNAYIREIVAAQNVVITHEDYVAKSQVAYIFPKVKGEDKNKSHRFVEMLIAPDKPEDRPHIILPPMNGLGLEKSSSGNSAEPQDSEKQIKSTKIVSDRQSLVSALKADRYFFEGNVKIEGEGIDGSCDKIEVIMLKNAPSKPRSDGAQGAKRGIDKIILFGNVKMAQGLKSATCGRADVYPPAGTVVLTDNPVVINKEDNTRAEGPRIVYVNGTKGVRIEPSLEAPFAGEQSEISAPKRPTLLLPEIGGK